MVADESKPDLKPVSRSPICE